MKLVTLLCACLFVTTGAWAYSRNCAQGPEYWCRDASTAEECGAVQHCQQTSWREKGTDKKPMTTSETAHMLCNVLVQASHELLADGSINGDSIKQYLRQDCAQLPHQNNLIQQCEMAVDIYLPDILRHLESGTELTKICSVIQGHDTSNVFLPKLKPLGITPNQTCVLCEFIVHILQTFATGNTTAQELAHILEQICKEMPSVLRDECKSFIDTYGQDIIALLVREFDPAKTCELIKLCPKPKNVAFLTKPNAQACGLCDYVSTYLAAGYPIENVCAHFSTEKNIKQQCEILVHLYKPNFCSQLPLCFDEVEVQPVKQSAIKSIECSLCKYVVGYIDTIIQNNKSEAAIEAALGKVCTIVPAALKDKCDQFVVTYGPVLAQLLAKYATPDQVCAALKLCQNGTQELNSIERGQQLKLVESSIKSIPCILCKYIIGYLNTETKGNKSAAAIEAALQKVCDVLPAALKTECTQFVQKYGPIIAFLFAKNATALEICDFIKVCNNGTQELNSIECGQQLKLAESSLKSIPCILCRYIIGYLDTETKGNKSAAAIEAALQKVCDVLPAALKTECTQFVQKYGPIIAFLFAKNATALQICDFIKVCNNGTQECTSIECGQQLKLAESSLKSIPCILCKYIIGYLDTETKGNKSAAAIEAALQKVCDVLPAALKTECTQFVQKYGPIIAFLFAKNATALQICDFIKVCNNGTQQVIPHGLDPMLKIKQSAIKSVECSLCKYVVGYIDTIIQNNRSEAAIEAALGKVCTILPAALKDKCDQFVVTYGPVLAQLLAKYATPDQVCAALKLCQKGTQEMTPLQGGLMQMLKTKQSAIKSVECSLCKYVVNYIDAVIQTNRSEAAIEAALEKVCVILPAPLKAGCLKFVDAYGPILVPLIEKYGTADKVCNALQVCHNGTQVAESIAHNIAKSIENTKDGSECTLCKYVLSYINLLIKNNSTEQELEKALEVVCAILPSSYHDKCSTFVHAYGPILAELIAELDDPNTVCQWLGVCSKAETKLAKFPVMKMQKLQSLPCNLCQYLVHYLDAIVQSNSTETKFEDALDKACKVLPEKKLQAECQVLVHLYGGDLIKLLVEYGDPKAVCQAIGICDK